MRLNIYFKCIRCNGTGWETPNSPCTTCKGKGVIIHRLKDVIKVIEFPNPEDCTDLKGDVGGTNEASS